MIEISMEMPKRTEVDMEMPEADEEVSMEMATEDDINMVFPYRITVHVLGTSDGNFIVTSDNQFVRTGGQSWQTNM